MTETLWTVDESGIRDFSAANNEPEWLLNVRLDAFKKAEDLPLPKPDKTKIDKWNFTEFGTHAVKSAPFNSFSELPEAAQAVVGQENAMQNVYVQRNGVPSILNISNELKEAGVIFTDFATAAKEHSDLLQKYFMTQVVKADEHKLTALHAALVNGGVFLYVPKNVEIKEPVQAVFIHDNQDAAIFNHVIVVTEANSSVTYVENYISTVETKQGVANIVTEVIAGNNSQVSYGAVDTLTENVTTYVNRRGVTAPNARIEWSLGIMNDGNTISENVTNLIGDGSFADTKMVVVGRGSQSMNFTTKVVHFGKHTEGYILKHGVMKDAAKAIFNGIGKIEHGAAKSNAVQESRILMLSEKARGDANPILLIDEDDVTAGHAASVGRVDPLQLYYLMSRGIEKREAERLVIHGFLAPVVNKLPIKNVKKQLKGVIERKVRQ
ncbi:Fe-S cluster assembly protein SufD [Domibacillus sp. A3M-37]|uniref:Fe-S cluster assembly protein SufD n=1 Tax=Domibacillus sp. A3M-37 TaxID=2962037 RepID=UPI0020B845E3|nr:Fe-S cluster assembly protein SufD [Domibacillus sp. A3M-37]MCP3760847.1 Fe-S cluster assembly protein SufD [Domibacillus sp. A3M-37]